jgi:hypothetical protein
VPDDGGQERGQELRPATREEVMDSLAHTMRCQGRRRVRDRHANSFMARIAAERLAEHLRLSGFVVMKRPPAQAPSATLHMPSRLPLTA